MLSTSNADSTLQIFKEQRGNFLEAAANTNTVQFSICVCNLRVVQ
jgi:hypothetical protein